VRDGFNPHGAFDEGALERMAQTMRDGGVLQPLLVAALAVDELESGVRVL
jgi:hypothetical protein